MPKNVGRYEQGGIKTQPDWTNESGGAPKRPTPPAAPPKSQVAPFQNDKTVGNNDGHKAH